MRRFLHDYTFKWWEISLLKITLFVAGILVGSFFSDFFGNYTWPLLGLLALGMMYWLGWWMRNLSG